MKSTTKKKLNYRYNSNPFLFFDDPDGRMLWGQELSFTCEPVCTTKKELLQKRAAIVRDVAAVLMKHGISQDEFNRRNKFI